MRWSFFTLIYHRSSHMNYFIYTSHHFTPHGRYELIDHAPNVWLHSSVGRASHQYRGGHRFESRWSPDFFKLLLSSCLNWKIYCDDHFSLWVFTLLLLLNCFFCLIYFYCRQKKWGALQPLPLRGPWLKIQARVVGRFILLTLDSIIQPLNNWGRIFCYILKAGLVVGEPF